MVSKLIEDYRANFEGLSLEESHCANCQHLGMCLGLGFSQPIYHPKDALQRCSHFLRWLVCDKCGQRKTNIGKDTIHWACRHCPSKKEDM